MNSSLTIGLVAGLVAGAVSGVAVSVLGPGSGHTTDVAALDSGADLADLQDMVAGMRRDQSELIDRVGGLEQNQMLAAPGATRAPASVDLESTDVQSAVLEALASMEESGTPIVTPDLRKQVENVLEMRAEEKRLEDQQRRLEQAAKRIEDRLAKVQTELGLDQTQVGALREVYQQFETNRDESRQLMREMRDSGGDFGDLQVI